MDVSQVLTAEEFSAWFTPQHVLSLLGKHWGLSTAISAINERLRAGLVVAATESAVQTINGNVTKFQLAWIPPAGWVDHVFGYASPFWDTGQIELRLTGTGHYAGDTLALFNVKFRPADILKMLPDEPSKDDKAATPDRPTVSQEDLRAWHELFQNLHPNAVESLAVRSAAAMFPDNHIPRQWVRDLRGPQPRGKPTSRHE